MKPLKIVLLIVAIFLISAGATMYAYSQAKIVEVKEIKFNVSVANYAGFVAEATVPLQFGALPPGATSKRKVDVTNDKDFPVTVVIKGIGSVGDWIEKERFELASKETKNFQIKLNVPPDTEYGTYNGAIRLYSIKK